MKTLDLNKFSWFDEYLASLEKAYQYMDLSTLQPTSWRHFQPLISKEWLDWFWTLIEKREKDNISYEKLAEVFEPDLCREHLFFILEDFKSAKWPMEKRLRVTDFLYQILKAQMPQGDPFGLHGSTRRHSKKDIEKIRKEKFEKGTPLIARELGKLYNGAYNLGASLFLDFYMGKAIENWGPYELPDGRILVIKEMRYLKPLEIWPDIETICNKIDLYAVYEGVKFSTDLIACHTQYEGDTINGLKEWKMIVDKKEVTDINEIKKIALNLAEVGSGQWSKLIKLPEPALLEKAVWIRNYCFNEMCKLLGMDWRPTLELLNAVKGKTLEEGYQTWKNEPTEEKAYMEYWRKIIDPRIEFYP